MNELKTHIISTVCLGILLLLPLIYETNPVWLLSVIIMLLMMILRLLLGEITKRTESFFVVMIISVFATSVLITIFQINPF